VAEEKNELDVTESEGKEEAFYNACEMRNGHGRI